MKLLPELADFSNRTPPPRGSTSRDDDPAAGPRQTSLLIVEDEALTALAMTQTLEAMGYDVVGSVGTGRGALALAKQHRPDVVLMDVTLRGDMDGIAAAEHIARELNIPIVFITAHTDAMTRARMEAVRPIGIISKPWVPATLHRALAAIRGGNLH